MSSPNVENEAGGGGGEDLVNGKTALDDAPQLMEEEEDDDDLQPAEGLLTEEEMGEEVESTSLPEPHENGALRTAYEELQLEDGFSENSSLEAPPRAVASPDGSMLRVRDDSASLQVSTSKPVVLRLLIVLLGFDSVFCGE